MTFEEFRTRYSLGGANLLSVSLAGRTLTLETELISANQPSTELRESGKEFVEARIVIETAGISQPAEAFVGFADSQDGEVSNFGPAVPEDGYGHRYELAFFVHDYGHPPGGEDIVVLEFDIQDIAVILKD